MWGWLFCRSIIWFEIQSMEGVMKAKVTEEGVTIPKRMLEGVEEVEICKESDGIRVVPLKDKGSMGLGERQGMVDALEQLAASRGALADPDPASWERGVRRDRPLPGRDFR